MQGTTTLKKNYEQFLTMDDRMRQMWEHSGFRRWCRWGLPPCGLLRRVCWVLSIGISGQHIGPIFKGLGLVTLEDRKDRLSRNVDKELTTKAA